MAPDERVELSILCGELRRYLLNAMGEHVPAPAVVSPDVPVSQPDDLAALNELILACTRCPRYARRRRPVCTDRPQTASLMIVGDPPNAAEDRTGAPFSGKSGEMLRRMLEALNVPPESVFLTTIVKCGGSKTMPLEPAEAEACRAFLDRQIDLVNPAVILAMGSQASQSLTGDPRPLMELRKHRRRYRGRTLIATLHPSQCVLDPGQKKYLWYDVRSIPSLIGLPARD